MKLRFDDIYHLSRQLAHVLFLLASGEARSIWRSVTVIFM